MENMIMSPKHIYITDHDKNRLLKLIESDDSPVILEIKVENLVTV